MLKSFLKLKKWSVRLTHSFIGCTKQGKYNLFCLLVDIFYYYYYFLYNFSFFVYLGGKYSLLESGHLKKIVLSYLLTS